MTWLRTIPWKVWAVLAGALALVAVILGQRRAASVQLAAARAREQALSAALDAQVERQGAALVKAVAAIEEESERHFAAAEAAGQRADAIRTKRREAAAERISLEQRIAADNARHGR